MAKCSFQEEINHEEVFFNCSRSLRGGNSRFGPDETTPSVPAPPPARSVSSPTAKLLRSTIPARAQRDERFSAPTTIRRSSPTERSGALAPMKQRSSSPMRTVTIGGKSLPAGSYTIFTIPNPDKWTLIVNKKTAEWGIPYKYEADELGRFDMKVSKTSSAGGELHDLVRPVGQPVRDAPGMGKHPRQRRHYKVTARYTKTRCGQCCAFSGTRHGAIV